MSPEFRLQLLQEGRDPAGKGYSLEREMTVDYDNVEKLWKRTGKFSGISDY